jgi:spore coat polysaccharide biosynthesis protein SpsF
MKNTQNEQPVDAQNAPHHQASSPAIAIIQARMGSSRLPGKVLLEIEGQPMLVHVVERARRAKSLEGVIVATTMDPKDDPIVNECRKRGYSYYRGSIHDVLDRYYQAAKSSKAEIIVRLTGDCPIMEPGLIDQAVRAVQTGKFDFACTRLPPPWQRTFPIGLDVEVCTFSALEQAWENASQAYHREHVMPYLYEECRSQHFGIILGMSDPDSASANMEQTIFSEIKQLPTTPASEPSPFNVLVYDHQPDYGNYRWTVDTPEDLEAIRKIFRRFRGRSDFNWYEVINLIQREPELAYFNTEGKAKDYRESDPRR